MYRRFRAPSPAFVISAIALLIALGGTTYAAATLPRNSVGTKQLRNNAVTASKIKTGAVTAAKISTKGLSVPNAQFASAAGSATAATNATHATSADTATNATNAANANTVGGFAPNGLTRLAYIHLDNTVSDGEGLKALVTVNLTVPSAGFVLVHADADINAPNTVTDVGMLVRDPVSSNTSFEDEVEPGSTGAGTVSASAVFPVTPGVRSFEIEGQVVSGTGTAHAAIDATAIFSPFDSTGS